MYVHETVCDSQSGKCFRRFKNWSHIRGIITTQKDLNFTKMYQNIILLREQTIFITNWLYISGVLCDLTDFQSRLRYYANIAQKHFQKISRISDKIDST